MAAGASFIRRIAVMVLIVGVCSLGVHHLDLGDFQQTHGPTATVTADRQAEIVKAAIHLIEIAAPLELAGEAPSHKLLILETPQLVSSTQETVRHSVLRL